MFDFIRINQKKLLTKWLSFSLQDISHKMVTALINADASVETIKNAILENSEDKESLLKQVYFIKTELGFLLNYSKLMSRWFFCSRSGDGENIFIEEAIEKIISTYPIKSKTDKYISNAKLNVKNFCVTMSFTDFSYIIKRIFYVISFFSISELASESIIFFSKQGEEKIIITAFVSSYRKTDNLFDLVLPRKEKENIFWGLSDIKFLLMEYGYSLSAYKNETGKLVFIINFGDEK